MNNEELIINGVVWVKKCDNELPNNYKYVVVRTYSAGVHAGFLESRNGKEVVLKNTRRCWGWEGAATLSQLAGTGTSKPSKCKFPAPIDEITLTEAIEVIPCTDQARDLIQGVTPWVA